MKGFQTMYDQLPSSFDIFTICLAELIGTGFLLFFGCMSLVGNEPGPQTLYNATYAFGMVVMVVIMIFGHVSAAHLNPAVTTCSAMLGKIPVLMVPFYFGSQIVGGIIGFFLLKILSPPQFFNDYTCMTLLHPHIKWWEGFSIEFMLTSALVFVCCGVWDPRNDDKYDSISIRFGFTVAVLALVGARYTGCSMNPARSFAPALINNNWTDHWIYWVSPMVSAVATTALYIGVFLRRKKVPIDEESID